jgi:hypothetical protein
MLTSEEVVLASIVTKPGTFRPYTPTEFKDTLDVTVYGKPVRFDAGGSQVMANLMGPGILGGPAIQWQTNAVFRLYRDGVVYLTTGTRIQMYKIRGQSYVGPDGDPSTAYLNVIINIPIFWDPDPGGSASKPIVRKYQLRWQSQFESVNNLHQYLPTDVAYMRFQISTTDPGGWWAIQE